jgi:DNA repair exonuclease SbcCD ATPase subunit
MSRNYREMDSKIEKLMQEDLSSIINDIKMFDELINKLSQENKTGDINLLARFVTHFLKSLSIRIMSLTYLQKETLHNFVWAQEQIENINERFEKINPEDTKEIESKLNEMHNKFESTLGALSSRLEKMNQEEEELTKKMKDNMFYG